MSSQGDRGEGLIVERVSHRYGRTPVVREASLAVRPGEIHSLLGPSGSGKTTLLRLVAGLEILIEGEIRIAGEVVASSSLHVPPEARNVGLVFQDYALFPHLNARKNVLFGLKSVQRSERKGRADELLASVGMAGFERAMPHTLSGGQQQRVALARALASQPRVMLLDEPFSGLDVRLRGDVRTLTKNVLHASSVATLLVTHDPQEALLISDRISVIRNGVVEQTGVPNELYYRPRTRHVAEIFGLTNRFSVEPREGSVATPWGPIPLPAEMNSDSQPRQLTMLVRPESLQLGESEQAGAVAATISGWTLQGETSSVQLSLATGQTVTASVSPYASWKVGDNTSVMLAPNSAIFLTEPDG